MRLYSLRVDDGDDGAAVFLHDLFPSVTDAQAAMHPSRGPSR